MPRFKVPYFKSAGTAKSPRFYFFPSSRHRDAGWIAVRLYDEKGVPVRDEFAAMRANQPLVQLYQDWMAGKPDSGPDRIDNLGRIKSNDPVVIAKARGKTDVLNNRRYAPGTIGALCARYATSKYFLTRKQADGTRAPRSRNTITSYMYAIRRTVEEWGDSPWHSISAVMAEDWLEELAEARGPETAAGVYRVIRLICNTARKLFTEQEPGYIALHGHAFAALGIPTRRPEPEPWPRDLVLPMVAFCDEQGYPSMGDAILFNSWLGQRPGDVIRLPLSGFDKGFPLFVRQMKTGAKVVLPWQRVPVLVARYDQMMVRRQRPTNRRVEATTFAYDDSTGRPFTRVSMGRLFRELREGFAAKVAERHPKRQPRWLAEYAAEHFADTPFDYNVERMQFRTLRHTAVTLLADAEVEDIGAITGHSDGNIKKIIRHYRAATASRAGAGFAKRLQHDSRLQLEALTTPKLTTLLG